MWSQWEYSTNVTWLWCRTVWLFEVFICKEIFAVKSDSKSKYWEFPTLIKAVNNCNTKYLVLKSTSVYITHRFSERSIHSQTFVSFGPNSMLKLMIKSYPTFWCLKSFLFKLLDEFVGICEVLLCFHLQNHHTKQASNCKHYRIRYVTELQLSTDIFVHRGSAFAVLLRVVPSFYIGGMDCLW